MECHQRQRKGTPVSIDGAHSRGSVNESMNNFRQINSKDVIRVSNNSGFSGQSNDVMQNHKNSNSQTRLHTSSSQLSNNFNTSVDQVNRQNRCNQYTRKSYINDASSSSTPNQTHNTGKAHKQKPSQLVINSGASSHNFNSSNQSNLSKHAQVGRNAQQ